MARFFNLFGKDREKKPVVPESMDYGLSLSDADLFKMQRVFQILPYQGDAYDNPYVRSSVDTNAKMRARIKPIHKRNGKVFPDKNIARLLKRPNRYMNWFDLVQKASVNYDLSGEAYLWIDFDETNGKPIGMYPLSPITVDAIKYEDDEELYLKFTFASGKILICLYRDVVHLRKSFFDKNNTYLFGDSCRGPLNKVLEWDYNLNEVTSKYLQNLGVTVGAIEVQQVVNQEDLKKLQTNFKETLTDRETDYRLVVLRPGMKYNQISTKSFEYPKEFGESNKDKIYSLFNCNDKIISGLYNETELNAYTETTIKTFSLPLQYELTEKLFQKKDRDRGDEIEIIIDTLEMLDIKTRATVLKQMFDVGAITPNEIREKIGFDKIEVDDLKNNNVADKIFTSLNYTTTENLTNYQNGKNGDNKDTNENE